MLNRPLGKESTPVPGSDNLRELLARRGTEAGLVAAASATPDTFQRTLTTRSNVDQALVSGLTFVINQGLVSTIQEAIQGVALRTLGGSKAIDAERWSRRSLVVDACAAGAGFAAQLALHRVEGESMTRAIGRTAGWLVSVAGASGTVAGGAHELAQARQLSDRTSRIGVIGAAGALAAVREFQRRRRERLDEGLGLEQPEISALQSLALGTAVSVGAAGLGRFEGWLSARVAGALAGILPGEETVWRPAGHLAALGMFALGGRAAAQRVFRQIEGRQTAFEAALDVARPNPEVSGSPDSVIPYATMSRMGRRMVWTLRLPDEIERVMGEPARAHPIRIYGGLELADTPEKRAALVLDDLERAGGLDRSWLMVASPTGTGYVNYAATGALEFLTRGDCATIALQYSARPSLISLDRVDEGREQFRLLIDQLAARLSGREHRPRVIVFGESLGAWTSQDAFLHTGTDGLVNAGIDHAIWIGTPYESKWKDQVLSEERVDVDSSLIGVFNDIDEWKALDPEQRERIRYVMVTHHDDGVALFGTSLLVQQPEWLGDPSSRPPGVPRSQRYIPVTTFVQTLIDMKNAARVVPGVFEAEGHDYRADLSPFLQAVLDLPASPDQLERVRLALEAEEATRADWIARHSRTGESMANELLHRIRESAPEIYQAVFAELGEEMKGWRLDWETARPQGG